MQSSKISSRNVIVAEEDIKRDIIAVLDAEPTVAAMNAVTAEAAIYENAGPYRQIRDVSRSDITIKHKPNLILNHYGVNSSFCLRRYFKF